MALRSYRGRSRSAFVSGAQPTHVVSGARGNVECGLKSDVLVSPGAQLSSVRTRNPWYAPFPSM
jgi:hypothetical protein